MGETDKTFLVGQEPNLYIALGRLLLEFCAAEEFVTILGSAFANGLQFTSPMTLDQKILEMGLERKVEETVKRIIKELAEYHPHDFAAACGHDIRTAGEKLCSWLGNLRVLARRRNKSSTASFGSMADVSSIQDGRHSTQ